MSMISYYNDRISFSSSFIINTKSLIFIKKTSHFEID